MFYIFLGILEYSDTAQWIFNKSSTYLENGNVTIIGWVHSHVQAVHTGFSSIDVHTQWLFAKEYKNCFGLVIEYGKSGFWLDHDFFTLTEIGINAVGNCTKSYPGLSKTHHIACNNRSNYTSIKTKIAILANIPCKVSNFTTLKDNLNYNETNKITCFERVCEQCNNPFEIDRFFKHVSHAAKCKKYYGLRWPLIMEEKTKINQRKRNDTIRERKLNKKVNWDALLTKAKADKLKNQIDAQNRASKKWHVKYKECQLEENKKSEMAKNYDNYVSTQKERGYAQDQKFLMLCKGCKVTFSTHVFYRHVSHSNSCKESYGNEWGKMKSEKRKIVKGASYDANIEKRLKVSKENYEKNKEEKKKYYEENKEERKKYYEKNKKHISNRMKQYHIDEKQREKDAEFDRDEKFFEEVWKPRMEKDVKVWSLRQKLFFEASICKEIERLRTKTLTKEMEEKLAKLEIAANETFRTIESDVEEAIKKARNLKFYKYIKNSRAWNEPDPMSDVFNIYKELNVDYRKAELRQDLEVLEKESRIVLKEVADEIGETLGERVYWCSMRLEKIENIKSRYKL